jgi:glucose-6-phosphate 1-dehydrogenase
MGREIDRPSSRGGDVEFDRAQSENPLRAGLRRELAAEPCCMVIFGASGDLTRRKLVPALYNLMLDRLLPSPFAVVGVSRRKMSDDEFRASLREGVESYSRRAFDENLWDDLSAGISFVPTENSVEGYRKLAEHLDRLDREKGSGGNRLFYVSTPPSAFPGIVDRLGEAGLNKPGTGGNWARIVLEKPIGRDLASARELNRIVGRVFKEEDVFRIDHYLGKETVQNLMVFRFANAIFEPLWNQKYVDHVQLTVAESIGVEGRGSYYEEAGTTRDMVQNHMFQLLCLTAMEPPASLAPDAIRDEKVKVLEALRPVPLDQVNAGTVRGQYAEGVCGGKRVPGYKQEENVAADSSTETYVALRLFIDNWRWGGVPFYLRAAKRMPKRVTEIALQFREVPHRLFDQNVASNTLALRIQPDEGINLKVESKSPGPQMQIHPVNMEFRYGTSFGLEPPEAYERLILDAILGDSTLFIRRDEVEASWNYIDRLQQGWRERPAAEGLPEYTAGTWGPAESDVLLARSGRTWRRI